MTHLIGSLLQQGLRKHVLIGARCHDIVDVRLHTGPETRDPLSPSVFPLQGEEEWGCSLSGLDVSTSQHPRWAGGRWTEVGSSEP